MADEETHLLPDQQTSDDHEITPPTPMVNGSDGDGELIIGLVGAVGTELKAVESILKERLEKAGYEVINIRISKEIIPLIVKPRSEQPTSEFQRISWGMDDGDSAREQSGDNSILALGERRKTGLLRQPIASLPLLVQ